jgi:hypothetical protein
VRSIGNGPQDSETLGRDLHTMPAEKISLVSAWFHKPDRTQATRFEAFKDLRNLDPNQFR